jgi:F-type H+-transporting ATPase subunit b
MSTTMVIVPVTNGALTVPTSLPAPALLASVTVDFDKGVFLQMAMFAIAIALLKPLLFDPMLRLFALREERTEGARAEARHMQERAAEILHNYEAEVARVRADATLERDALRKETAYLEAKIFADARAEAEQIAQAGRAQIAQEMAAFHGVLQQRTVDLSGQIVGSILGRNGS